MQIDDSLKFCPADGTPVVAIEEDPFVGRIILGRYRLDKRIGHGGMGSVYRGEHVLMGKTVALKLLHGDMSRLPQAVKRFEREARSMSKLDHPNLVGATDFGETEDGILFLVLEYLEGPTLAKLLRDAKRLEVRRALKIAKQMLGALDAAHRQGIVHRDLKPDNVILVERPDDHEFVKVLDFGIAKILHDDDEPEMLTRTGMVFGTPEYLSPEQGLGQHADHRADLYSLSVILYEMLTGVRPFRAENKLDIIAQHLTADPEPMLRLAPGAEIPPALDEAVKKGLAKKPDDRWPDAHAYTKALDAVITMLDDPATSPVALGKATPGATSRAIGTARDAGRVMGSTLGRLATTAFWRSLRAGGWQRPDAVASLALGMLLLVSVATGAVVLALNVGADASEKKIVIDTHDKDPGTAGGGLLTLAVNPVIKARKLDSDGKTAEALTVLKAALVDTPNDPDVNRAVGDMQLKLGHWPEAAAAYMKAMDIRAELKSDEKILAAAIAELEDPNPVSAMKLLTKVGPPAVPGLKAALVAADAKVRKLRGKSKTSAEAKKRLNPAKKKELDTARNVRVWARRTLEEIAAPGPDLVPTSAVIFELDTLPILVDEMKDEDCPEIARYVEKFAKLGDTRVLSVLQVLDKAGYDPKTGNACLKDILPETLISLMPK